MRVFTPYYYFIVIARHCMLWMAALALIACQSREAIDERLLRSTAEQVIIPAHQQFKQSALTLKLHSQTFCQQATDQHWQMLRQQWLSTMLDWQSVKLIAFGPATAGNQHWKVQFWPDKHNLIRKKVHALLNSQQALTVERLQQASVVVQGLSALEFLLFDNNDGKLRNYQPQIAQATRRCQLLQSIASHTEQVATALLQSWSVDGENYLATFTQPGENNNEFPDHNAAIATLVEALVSSVEQAKRDQLATPLGISPKGGKLIQRQPRPFLAQAWRSKTSLQLLRAHLQAARQLFHGGAISDVQRFGIEHYLAKHVPSSTLADTVTRQFTIIDDQLSRLDTTLADVKGDPQLAKQLTDTYHQIAILEELLKHDLPKALGVSLGFNSNDGD